MLKAAGILVMFSLAAASAHAGTLADLDRKNGFRDLKFGARVADVPNLLEIEVDGQLRNYTRTPDALTESFLGWLERCHGWRVPAHWLVWLPGVVTGFNLAARAVAETGGAIMIPTPIY